MNEKSNIRKKLHVLSSVVLFVSAPNVAPSDVGGGGGSNRELTITWAVSVKKLHMLFVALPTLNLKLILFLEIK